ncbi:hypothetical protein ACN47E_005759 [Coniothyrium glycines]
MPPRNNPVPNAVRLFNCSICDKGYPRQLDYENHLRSYDHNHRQRLADMKKLTAGNDMESNKPKQGLDMRSINIEDANKKPGTGSRFTKIGGAAPAAGGSRFKKVGVKAGEKVDDAKKEAEPVPLAAPVVEEEVVVPEIQAAAKKDEDEVMADEDAEEAITWEEYDFTKPTGCDHASCSGCKTDGIWGNEWVALGTS